MGLPKTLLLLNGAAEDAAKALLLNGAVEDAAAVEWRR
jgi:hypothetical protein